MKKWNKNTVELEAKKYDRRSDFQKKSSGAYNFAKRVDILNNICSHMLPSKTEPYTLEELIKAAEPYNTRKEFQIKCGGAYQTARKRGILDEVCPHMPEHVSQSGHENPRFKWTAVKLQEEALRYRTKNDFATKSSGAYDSARNLGILDDICSHMDVLVRRRWTLKELEEIAKSFKNKTEFVNKALGAYKRAIKCGILDEICSHMPKRGVVSQSEIDLLKHIREQYPKANTHRERIKKDSSFFKTYRQGFHIDIYIPELRKGIEFDGEYWHSIPGLKRSRADWPEEDLVNYHKIKDEYFKTKNIEILHIKEEDWLKNKQECVNKCFIFLNINEVHNG